jgi:hypothetical protein
VDSGRQGVPVKSESSQGPDLQKTQKESTQAMVYKFGVSVDDLSSVCANSNAWIKAIAKLLTFHDNRVVLENCAASAAISISSARRLTEEVMRVGVSIEESSQITMVENAVSRPSFADDLKQELIDQGVTPPENMVVYSSGGCFDGIQGKNESDIDCGGGCMLCAAFKKCGTGNDCASGSCSVFNTCASKPTCFDGEKGPDETDIDCGGGCAPCQDYKQCQNDFDCASGTCSGVYSTCSRRKTCFDGLQDGNESDIDCGGGCAPCTAFKKCNNGNDCASGSCSVFNKCAADFVPTNLPTNVPTAAPPLATPSPSSDPFTFMPTKSPTKAPTPLTCNDNIMNGDETSMDCGGAANNGCPRCGLGVACTDGVNCATGVCTGGACADLGPYTAADAQAALIQVTDVHNHALC